MSSERVVELLNAASITVDASEKLEALRIVQELLINKEPELLDNFLEEVMGFQKDRSQDVRKFVVGFIEEACKKDPDLLAKVIANLLMLISDSSVVVRKRVIQAMTSLYRVGLNWLCKARSVTDDMEAVWNVISTIKEIITHLIKEASNDGMRTHAIKFMEMLVITQTARSDDESIKSSVPASLLSTDAFSLDDVPLTLKIVRKRKLEEEASIVFEELIKFLESSNISSANLMTCMGAIANIAKLRPQFLSKVVTGLEILQANIPPSLAKSQVSSVRKHMKNQLLSLLRHPTAVEYFFTNITTLLTDLGASKEEVLKAMPAYEEMRRRVRKFDEKQGTSGERAAKKARLEEGDEGEDEEDEDHEDERNSSSSSFVSKKSQLEMAIDITEKFILERLDPMMASQIVMRSMANLPREIPPHFSNTYTPIAAAGTEGQIKHVARLMATQFTNAKLGPGIEAVKKMELENKRQEHMEIDEEAEGEKNDVEEEKKGISTVIAGKTLDIRGKKSETKKKVKVQLQPAGMSVGMKKSRSKGMKLADITYQLSSHDRKVMMNSALTRLLGSEKTARMGGIIEGRSKIITALSPHFSNEMKSNLLTYVFEDLKTRIDLAFSWLYEEYCFYQGFNRSATMLSKRNDDSEYNRILCLLIRGILDKVDSSERNPLLRRLYLEVPIITDDAVQLLKEFIQFENTAIAVVTLIKDLVFRRPTKKLNFLNFLLEFCSHEMTSVRESATETVVELHASKDVNEIIEDYAVMYLRFLLSPSPPSMLFGDYRGRHHVSTVWTEDIVRVCIHLYLSLLPHNLKLFHHLMDVYVSTSSENKRIILRVLDSSIKSIDMSNEDLLKAMEEFPKGAETLLTRVINILTDKARPTPQLVAKVRDLYETRVSDVRFIIPVLHGLSKQEVINSLPKLVGLSPVVVKEVFSRLLNPASNGPLSASDLLIALHNIDPSKGDMKSVIKATSICLQDKQMFTQDVLAITIQQLMEQPSVPLLFMRTVIQAISIYPRLTAFVMNVLQRLIVKQVWKQPKVWDGFIRCCEKTVPQSYAVMLQLPPPQLRMLLDSSPDLREPLLEHVQNFNEAQRAHVPAAVMEVLYNADVMAANPRMKMENIDDDEDSNIAPGEESTNDDDKGDDEVKVKEEIQEEQE